jgi:hypothetical protein
MHTPSQNIKHHNSFLLAITAAATNGASADALGFERARATFTATPSGAGTTADCKLQESSDNSTFTDVTSAVFTQITTAGGQKVQQLNVDLRKRLRYLRLVFTGAGGSAAGQACGNIDLLVPRNVPVALASNANADVTV